MTIYESRWKNAVRWAKRVNRYLAEGHLVFVGEGDDREEIKAPLQIQDGLIFGPFGPGDKSGIVWFRYDTEFDEGMYTEIDEWNERNKVFCYALVAVPLDVTEAHQ